MDLSDISNCASLGSGCYLGWQPPKMSLLSFSQLHLLNIIFVFNLCVCVCVCTHMQVQKGFPNVLVRTLIFYPQ